jgi:hypothetical protein
MNARLINQKPENEGNQDQVSDHPKYEPKQNP